jgi:D-alanyl-D-alanine dipeptidase
MSCNSSESDSREVDSIEVKTNFDTLNIERNITEIEENLIEQGLVNIKDLDASVLVDLKYSSKDNFFGQDVYGDFEEAYLQKEPAQALKLAQYLLRKKNPALSLLILDATRPLHIQKILWESLDSLPPQKRKDFVADPNEGSIHNYGCAVDLTIFDQTTKKPLDMGTPFDYFGYEAYPRLEIQMLNNGKLDSNQIKNRHLLRGIMETAGFEHITSEWWHFNFYSRERAKSKYKIVK